MKFSLKLLILATLAISAVNAASLRGLEEDDLALETTQDGTIGDAIYELASEEEPVEEYKVEDASDEVRSSDYNFEFLGANALDGIKAAEQILAEVNKVTDLPKKVDGNSLLDLAKKIVANDKSITSPDANTKKILDALQKIVEKLFPGVKYIDTIKNLIPKIPLPKRMLEEVVDEEVVESSVGDAVNVEDEEEPVHEYKVEDAIEDRSGESYDFQVLSANAVEGVKTAEQILEEMNKITKLPKKVDGGSLLDIAKKIVAGDKAVKTPDDKTKAILDDLKKVIEKLFPGQKLEDIVKKIIPMIK